VASPKSRHVSFWAGSQRDLFFPDGWYLRFSLSLRTTSLQLDFPPAIRDFFSSIASHFRPSFFASRNGRPPLLFPLRFGTFFLGSGLSRASFPTFFPSFLFGDQFNSFSGTGCMRSFSGLESTSRSHLREVRFRAAVVLFQAASSLGVFFSFSPYERCPSSPFLGQLLPPLPFFRTSCSMR